MQKLYIDANVFKFSATRLVRYVPREQIVNWGGQKHSLKVHDVSHVNPNDAITDPILKAEADLLPSVAALVRSGRIIAVTQMETELETWRMRNLDSDTGTFFGATIAHCDAPITYGRVVAGVGVNPRKAQIDFLSNIDDARFREIQKAVGAYQGKGKFSANQLLDAFAIWCAEFNECDAFLSLDFQLARVVSRDRKCRVRIPILRPSEVLSATI